MAALTPEEEAANAATPAWRALPTTVARHNELRAIAVANGHRFDPAGMTAILQAFAALNEANPIPDVIQAQQQGLV